MPYFGEDIQAAPLRGTYLRDFKHASKIFRPGGFDLAPKFKFLFHTFFDINPVAYGNNVNTGDNFGVLVKTVRLPSFSMKVQELNQYNRKRLVQTKIMYDPINITFHDDNVNMITKLWDAYYRYYYKDTSNFSAFFKGSNEADTASSEPGAGAANQNYNQRNIYAPDLTGNNNWGYIGESFSAGSNTKAPFFRNITVFGFNRHNFTAYSLINPLITKCSHDSYSYSEGGGTMEIQMDINYETVVYNEGAMDGQTPDALVMGFGLDQFYDKTTSVITPKRNKSLIARQGKFINARGGVVRPLNKSRTPF